MREFEIVDSSHKKKDVRNVEISAERLAELYPDREIFAFWRFVELLKKEGRSEFAVSRAQNDFEKDSDLMFFSVGGVAENEHPKITFLGKNVAKGSIEIYNRFAAETYGFSVLQFEKKPQKRGRK